jgi:hypothetical protein
LVALSRFDPMSNRVGALDWNWLVAVGTPG